MMMNLVFSIKYVTLTAKESNSSKSEIQQSCIIFCRSVAGFQIDIACKFKGFDNENVGWFRI